MGLALHRKGRSLMDGGHLLDALDVMAGELLRTASRMHDGSQLMFSVDAYTDVRLGPRGG